MARKPAPPGTDRRQQMLAAALDVFAEQGFEGAKTKEIAELAGVAQGLIYFYFRSKEELFLAAFEHHAARALTQLNFDTQRESDEPPEDVLPQIISRFVDVMGAPHTVNLLRILVKFEGRLPISTEPHGTGDHQVIAELALHLHTALHTYLQRQISSNRLRSMDTEITAHFVASGLVSMMIRRALGSPDVAHFTRAQLVASVVDMLTAGSPRPGDVARPVASVRDTTNC